MNFRVGTGLRDGEPSDPQDVWYYLWRWRDPTCPLWIDFIRAFSWASTHAVPARLGPGWPPKPAHARDAALFEQHLIEQIRALEKHGVYPSKDRIAQALGYSRRTLDRRCAQFGIAVADAARRAKDGET
jgi:hypothetical protein